MLLNLLILSEKLTQIYITDMEQHAQSVESTASKVKLMFADADNCEAFNTNFEADLWKVKQHFWDHFHKWLFDL